MLHEVGQRAEGGAARDEEATLVQLPDPVVFDRVAVPHRERVVVAARLRVSYKEGAMLVLGQKQLLLRLDPFDLAVVPSAERRGRGQ